MLTFVFQRSIISKTLEKGMMKLIRLRPYKPCDAKKIVSWCKDEKTFLKWGGEHFGKFPISEEIMNNKYLNNNGGCAEEDNFYPMTAFDEDGIFGHFIMRYIHGDNKILRFGWVIVDDTKRGKKYGQNMLSLGLKYAFEILGVDKVTLGVFENNIPAYHCYQSVGFQKAQDNKDSFAEIQGEKWRVIELEITKAEYEQ